MTAAELDAKARRLSIEAQRDANRAAASTKPADLRFYAGLAQDEARRASQYARAAAEQSRRERATW